VSLDLNDGGPQFTGYDIHDLNERLAERANEWVPIYFPRGFVSKNRRELRLANISGDPPRNLGSCSIALKGEDAGCWWDFQDEKGGGPLDTLAHATGLFGRELFAKATEIVGGPRQKGRPPASRPNGPTKSVASEHILLATSIWETTQDPYGTPTEAYIVDVRGLGAFPSSTEDLRHCEFCTDYAAKIARPAMIARIRRADTGEPTGGIHRTYLLEDGRPAKEAMGGKHKMALGPTQIEGGVVMLASMTADGRLGVAEGIETALAMTEINRRATGELFPIWATLGDWGMASMPFPPGLRQLLIFADGGKAGVTAAERLQGRALAAGIDAQYFLPKSGDDFARDLELRLWETSLSDQPTTANPGDDPSVSPPATVSAPPRAPPEGSPREPFPRILVALFPTTSSRGRGRNRRHFLANDKSL